MKLVSASFSQGQAIPAQYAFARIAPDTHITLSDNINPHLAWTDIPAGTRSLVLICHDSNVPSTGEDVNQEGKTLPVSRPRIDFYHWVLLDIPASTTEIPAGSVGSGGATRLPGVPKLTIAEARNFPAVAQYYHDAVIVRGRALLRTLLKRGIERGEFRPLDLETAIDVIYAPLMMLVVWRFSMCFCGTEIDPDTYLKTHFDLLVQGLCQPKGLA